MWTYDMKRKNAELEYKILIIGHINLLSITMKVAQYTDNDKQK